MKKNRFASNRGFTLLELLISSSMLAALFVFCLSFSNRLIKGYKAVQQELHLSIEAQRILDIFESDLESAFIDPQESFYIKYDDVTLNNSNTILSFYTLLADSSETKESPKTGYGQIMDSLYRVDYKLILKEMIVNHKVLLPGYYRQKSKCKCKYEKTDNDQALQVSLTFVESSIEPKDCISPHLKNCTFQFYIKDLKTGEIKPVTETQFNFPGSTESPYDPRQFKLAYVDASLMLSANKMNTTSAMKTPEKQSEVLYTRRIIFWAEPFVLPYECLVSSFSS